MNITISFEVPVNITMSSYSKMKGKQFHSEFDLSIPFSVPVSTTP